MNIRECLDAIAAERILVLDGAMGTMIQKFRLVENEFRGERFANHPISLKGCNDILCLTKPGIISSIHGVYLRSGADILETCSFNATSISLADYGLSDHAYDINLAAAEIARLTADRYTTVDKPRFVAGVLGPTSKTASVSPDVNDPGARGVSWDELVASYGEAARGLLDGGADLFMVETVFDTLNAKAALHAIAKLNEERGLDVPVMVSGTVVDAAGRTLSGQTMEAFYDSIAPFKPWSVGLNCSFGAERLKPHSEALAAICPVWTSVHPNAGLPNRFGDYDEEAETTAGLLSSFVKDSLVNIVGGCCGTTPAHISAIANAVAKKQPRKPPKPSRHLRLSGLEPLVLDERTGFVDIGERTNVAGSRKFLRLVKEENYSAALSVAREMVETGAGIIDVCMDDALLDAPRAMSRFLALSQSDPEIARVPVMLDSSRWEAIVAGLKMVQGKCLVNSISLKEGEEAFLAKAAEARSFGAAVVVMLFDEAGQADHFERKIQVAERSYRLLVESGFPPEDIVFDPNVLAVATGIPEHDRYALDFIRACQWILEHCPGVSLSGGISNLSFSFRGMDAVREAMHSVFLKHASAAGLSMAIVNPAGLVSYEDLEQELRDLAEDVILARREDASSRLLERATALSEAQGSGGKAPDAQATAAKNAWRELDVEERIVYALIRGIEDWIEQDVLEARPRFPKALGVIEGPLMRGMDEVGDRFGSGRMFLPQVIKSARVMKRAVAVLEPFINEEKAQDASGAAGGRQGRGTIVMATVKGDVHDIGKNIVGVVLGCNGYEVLDLGVMVPAEEILDTAQRVGADLVGLSGLITPSLDEMVHVASEMERRGFTLPLLIGGATTSEAHTALRISPAYSHPVIHVKDASRASSTVRALLSTEERPAFLERVERLYGEAMARHERIEAKRELLTLDAARENPFIFGAGYLPPKPGSEGIIIEERPSIATLIPYIDWSYFFYAWDLGNGFERILEDPEKGETARRLYEDAQRLLERMVAEERLEAKGVLSFLPAGSEGDDLVLLDAHGAERARFSFPRNQERKLAGGANPCLADFIAPRTSGRNDWVGLFAVTSGLGAAEFAETLAASGDDYGAILVKTLADRLAEAFAEYLHEKVRRELWGYAPEEKLSAKELFAASYRGIRPAFGYPSCPDHGDKALAFSLLDAEARCGMSLTSSSMIQPSASVCGLYFAHPGAYYFGAGALAEDQIADLAKRKGLDVETTRKRMGV